MNFFKSILADDSEPENSDDHEESDAEHPSNQSQKPQELEKSEDPDPDPNLNSNSNGLWSFGDLVKTLTTRSESVLETYRRDLKEFGSGLRKESDLIREVASRAVKDLPSSIEVGASAIDGVLKSTAEIIAQGKDAVLAPSDDEFDASETRNSSDRSSLNSKLYSRFDAQLNAIQSDARTYCEDPEDLDDYSKWKLGFVLSDKRLEIEKLIEDGVIQGIYEKLVPNEVDDDTFWCRYFFRVHKLKQQEDMRAKLVRRSLSADDEEELSWDVDDDDDDDKEVDLVKPKDLPKIEKKESTSNESKTEISHIDDEDAKNKGGIDDDRVDKGSEVELKSPSGASVSVEIVESVRKSDEKVDRGAYDGKDTTEDDDLEWDEIEDLGTNDENKVSQSEARNNEDLRKRLTSAEDDEDLTWDIEDDDDEPAKASAGK